MERQTRLQCGNRGELRIIPCIVKQEKLLAALLGDHLRNDGMIERFCGILRGYGARLIAIAEEILARLLVADDTDLQNTFPLLELVEGEGPQEFECVCHSCKRLDSTIRGNNIIIPGGQPGSHPNPAKRGGVFGEYPAFEQISGSCKKNFCGENFSLTYPYQPLTTPYCYYRYLHHVNPHFSPIMIGKLNSGQNL